VSIIGASSRAPLPAGAPHPLQRHRRYRSASAGTFRSPDACGMSNRSIRLRRWRRESAGQRSSKPSSHERVPSPARGSFRDCPWPWPFHPSCD